MTTRAALALGMVLAAAGGAHCDEPTEEQKKKITASLFQVAIADLCDKRFDKPDVLKLAIAVSVKAAVDAGIPDAEEKLTAAIKQMVEKPQEPTTGLSFATEKSCAKLEETLKGSAGQ